MLLLIPLLPFIGFLINALIGRRLSKSLSGCLAVAAMLGPGVTGVLLLAESHISIHTWPEAGFAAVDIFMCGAARPQVALDIISTALAARHCALHTARRAPPGQAIAG